MSDIIFEDSFEALWDTEKSHRCLIFPAGGNPYEADVGNIFTPPGWVTWFRHEEGVWAQPEVRDAWKDDNDYRVRSGEKAILLFTFGRKHDAGFLRQVDVTPGDELRLTAWAHAWSNHKDKNHPDDFPHPDDPHWSEGESGDGSIVVGYNDIAIHEGDVPPLSDPNNPDRKNDAIGNFTFWLGIDPTGGTDPYAGTVVWGDGYCVYNDYVKELAVEATAEASTVTVFLRSRTLWPYKHNDAYWDDVALARVGGVKPGRGQPRVQYARTYNVIPASATEDEAVAVFLEGWQRSRETAGGSHDDAGIGDLDERRANVYGIPEGERQAYLDFYEQYYPGVGVAFKDIPGGNGGNGPGPEPDNPQVTPSIGVHAQGWKGGIWEYYAAVRPRVAKVFWFEAVDEIKAQSPETAVIVRHFTPGYDDLYGLLPDRLAAGRRWVDKFRDAAHATADRLAAMFPNDPELARYYIEGPNELYPSLNAEAVIAAADLDVGVCQAIYEMGRNIGPAAFCAAVGNPHESEYELLLELAAAIEACGGLAGLHTYWPVHYGDGGPDTLLQYLWGRWQGIDDVWRANGITVRWYGGEAGAIGAEWGEGAPPASIAALVLDAARRGVRGGRLIVYGPRGSSVIDVGTPLWYAQGMPFSMQEVLSWGSRWNRFLDWLRGLFGGREPSGWVWMNPEAGWRHESCYDGDWDAYLADILRADELNAQWNADHGGRRLGDVLFTTGINDWWDFLVNEPEWNALREAMEARYA